MYETYGHLKLWWDAYRAVKSDEAFQKLADLVCDARVRFGRAPAKALAMTASGALVTYDNLFKRRPRCAVCPACGAAARFFFEGLQRDELTGANDELWTCLACGTTRLKIGRKGIVSMREAIRELILVLRAWTNREGDLPGLLVSWFEVASKRVVAG